MEFKGLRRASMAAAASDGSADLAAATAEAQASTAAELKNEDELQGNSEFLPFQKADNDDVHDTVEVVALDAEPTVEEAQPTIAETLTATARAAYATASSLVDAVATDTPPPPIDLDETPPPSEEVNRSRLRPCGALRPPRPRAAAVQGRVA